ncbi:conserved hypothetical protein [Pseudomonas phage phiIBB-PF7A]|uniref:Uncharacterized protein n=1 Tax=Pseudomonas phage phiIBB-PF7A TaxID=942165 RepID=E9KIE9_9CAUD|nr:hypothetical protein phiIBB-PF7Ap12 [Pseudomonas phage phiIBB-PF7A]ADV35674.1 conserved hypothetical protein [Pseudomonas phage phiIBB-PF7A]
MNRAQGNTRSKPDGFLHIQNFTVTKHAGIAGAVWVHVFDDHQRGLVEGILIELAVENGRGVHHFKHNCWRFKKEFLQVNFEWAVFKLAQAVRMDPAQVLYQHVLRRDRLINKD